MSQKQIAENFFVAFFAVKPAQEEHGGGPFILMLDKTGKTVSPRF
jgi:hypothetical protein